MYGYCLRYAGQPPPPQGAVGVGGARIRIIEEGELGMWISEGGEPARPAPDALREHDHVVRTALRSATPLPLRFGACFAGEAAVRDALRERRGEWAAALGRVRGRVEVGVSVGWDAAAEAERLLALREELQPVEHAGGAGRAYLEARRCERALAEALHARAEDLLRRAEAVLPHDESPRVSCVLARPELAGSVAYLVPRERMGDYKQAFLQARTRFPDGPLTLSGPWAPYSFV